MSEQDSEPAVKIEVSESYMRWLANRFILPALCLGLLGFFGVKLVNIADSVPFPQQDDKSLSQ